VFAVNTEMSLRSWVEEQRQQTLRGLTFTHPQYYAWVVCVTAYELLLTGLNLFVLGRLASSSTLFVGPILLLGDSVLSVALCMTQLLAVLSYPETEYLAVKGIARYGYVLTPCLCLPGCLLFGRVLLASSQAESTYLLGFFLIGMHFGGFVTTLVWFAAVLFLLPSSMVGVAFPYHPVLLQRKVQKGPEMRDFLQSAPPLYYQAGMHDRELDDNGCAVCLHDMEDGAEVRRLSCGHMYHKPCLDEWLVIRGTCPLCIRALILPHTNASRR
jgi:hypothetical protein